jgi:Zn finger protein HypA/HybF involved in hydrogenase expression
MSKNSRTKLVSQSMSLPEKQSLEAIEEFSLAEQSEVPVIELDIEMECPRCSEIMELHSNFDELVYSCESCIFLLKCG